MVTIQWVVYMVVVCCALFGVLFLLYSFMAKQTAKHEEDEVDPSNKVWEENFPPEKNKKEDAGEE